MLGQLLIDSLLRPRAAARRLLEMKLPPEVILQGAVAIVCVGLVLGYAALALTSGEPDPVTAAVIDFPLLGAAVQFLVVIVIAALTSRIGLMFGGQGDFWGAMALVTMLNAAMAVIQTLQLALLLLAPPIAPLLALASVFWAVWAYTNFVTELHGFQRPVAVLGGVFLSIIVLYFIANLLFRLVGFVPQGAP